MPSRKTPDGEFKDIAHPINTDTREKIQTSILKAVSYTHLFTSSSVRNSEMFFTIDIV